MHPNPIFRKTKTQYNIAFARQQGFGMLCINGDQGPLLAHVPFLINTDATSVDLHLVRSNPIARVVVDTAVPAVIAVQGPHGYISPDWYGVDDQVPTWNYVAVHLRGVIQRLPMDQLRDVIDDLSTAHEERLHPKPPWHSAKMTPEVLDKMMRQIVPFQLRIETVDGTWKLSQNKPDAVRLSAADRLARDGHGSEVDALAALMRDTL